MARKTKIITITAEGRDRGRAYLITEMPAAQAEKWAARAFLALARSGVQMPDEVSGAGFAGLALMGLRALSGLRFEDAEPLMDEMFGCVAFLPDGRAELRRPLMEDEIEEVATRLHLREEVLELHTGFSLAGALSKSTAPAMMEPPSENT